MLMQRAESKLMLVYGPLLMLMCPLCVNVFWLVLVYRPMHCKYMFKATALNVNEQPTLNVVQC